MIFFVGDEPGKKNIDPEVAFVGTTSYKKLLGWIADMNLSINDIIICNKYDIKTYSWGRAYLSTKSMHDNGFGYVDIFPQDRFVALGRKAEKRLKKLKIDCFYLPHPSGANPSANKSKELNKLLKDCREFIFS